MTRVMLIGAQGILGKAMHRRLRETSCEVVTAGRHGCDLSLDLRHMSAFSQMFVAANPQWIIHCAATFSNDYEESCAVNVAATRQVLEAVRTAGSPARVVLIGSAAEYGAVVPEANPIREDHALAPISVYGLTKAWQTQLASLYASLGVDVVIARLFNLDGDGISQRLFVGRVRGQIDEVLAGSRTTLELGPLGAIRDYIHADEAADQILAIATHGDSGSVYHVASGRPTTMRALLEKHLAANGLEGLEVRESLALSNKSGPDVPVIYADMKRTVRLMNKGRRVAAV